MPLLESSIERKFRGFAKSRGFLEAKVHFVENGYPDRMLISPYGHFLWIEWKREGEVPDPIQNYRIMELRNRNQIAFWTDRYDESVYALEVLMEPAFVSAKGDPASTLSRFGRVILGSRIGQDVDRISRLQALEEKGVGEKNAYRRPLTTSLQGLARRDTEVGRLQRDHLHDLAWTRQTRQP